MPLLLSAIANAAINGLRPNTGLTCPPAKPAFTMELLFLTIPHSCVKGGNIPFLVETAKVS